MTIHACSGKDKQGILEIFNGAILTSTAIYDYKPRSIEMIDAWFDAKARGNYPVIGAFDDKDELLGFASYGTFRDRPGYKYTVEHSVYVNLNNRGKGIGTTLLKELIRIAIDQQYHVLVAGIDMENTVSVRLHEKLGFAYSGTIEHAGFKFGRWLNLVFYQLILRTPENPVDG